MDPMVWNDRQSVGNEALDEEHRAYFAWMNELRRVMLARGQHDEMHSILLKMRSSMLQHMTNEETIMELCGYPGIVNHRRQHKSFLADLDGILSRLESGHAIITFDHIGGLSEWLMRHVVEEDKRYVPFLTGMTTGQPSPAPSAKEQRWTT